jgi:hypothetical protein
VLQNPKPTQQLPNQPIELAIPHALSRAPEAVAGGCAARVGVKDRFGLLAWVATEQANDHSQEQPAIDCGDAGDVAHRELVWLGQCAFAMEHVG